VVTGHCLFINAGHSIIRANPFVPKSRGDP